MVNQNIIEDLPLLELNFSIDAKWTPSGNYQTGVQTIASQLGLAFSLGLGLELGWGQFSSGAIVLEPSDSSSYAPY